MRIILSIFFLFLMFFLGATAEVPLPESPKITHIETRYSEETEEESFGIWLSLIFWGLSFNLTISLLILTTVYLPDITNHILMTKADELCMIALFLIEVVGSFLLLKFMINRNAFFPYFIISFILLRLLLYVVNNSLNSSILPLTEDLTILKSLFISIIWIPYFLSSKKVKRIFIN